MRWMDAGFCEAGVRGAACWDATQHIKGWHQHVQRLRSSVLMQLVVVAVSWWLLYGMDPAAAGILALWAIVAVGVPPGASCSASPHTGQPHGPGAARGPVEGWGPSNAASTLHSSLQQCRRWCRFLLRRAAVYCRSPRPTGSTAQLTDTTNQLPAALHYTGCTRLAPISIKVHGPGCVLDNLRPVLLSAVQYTLQQQQQQQQQAPARGCVPPCIWLQAAVFEGCVQLLASVYQSQAAAQPPLGAATAQQLLRQVLGRLPAGTSPATRPCDDGGDGRPGSACAVVVAAGTATAAAGPHAKGPSSSSSSSGMPLLWMEPPALVAGTDHPQQLCLRLGLPALASQATSSSRAATHRLQSGASSSSTGMALVRQQQLGQQAAMQRVRVLVFDQHQVVLDEEVTLAPVIRVQLPPLRDSAHHVALLPPVLRPDHGSSSSSSSSSNSSPEVATGMPLLLAPVVVLPAVAAQELCQLGTALLGRLAAAAEEEAAAAAQAAAPAGLAALGAAAALAFPHKNGDAAAAGTDSRDRSPAAAAALQASILDTVGGGARGHLQRVRQEEQHRQTAWSATMGALLQDIASLQVWTDTAVALATRADMPAQEGAGGGHPISHQLQLQQILSPLLHFLTLHNMWHTVNVLVPRLRAASSRLKAASAARAPAAQVAATAMASAAAMSCGASSESEQEEPKRSGIRQRLQGSRFLHQQQQQQQQEKLLTLTAPAGHASPPAAKLQACRHQPHTMGGDMAWLTSHWGWLWPQRFSPDLEEAYLQYMHRHTHWLDVGCGPFDVAGMVAVDMWRPLPWEAALEGDWQAVVMGLTGNAVIVHGVLPWVALMAARPWLGRGARREWALAAYEVANALHSLLPQLGWGTLPSTKGVDASSFSSLSAVVALGLMRPLQRQVRLAALLPLVLHYVSHVLLMQKTGGLPLAQALLFYCCVAAVTYCSWAACNISSRRLFVRHAQNVGLVVCTSSSSSKASGRGRKLAEVPMAAGAVQPARGLECE